MSEQPKRLNVVARALEWLKAGYPSDIPADDRVALLGILHRHLSDSEVEQVVIELRHAHGAPYSDEEIAERIKAIALEKASEQDIRRVAARLAAAGWPLGDVEGVERD